MVPDGQGDAVIIALYAEAERIGWETLAPTERSTRYDRWVEDPDVGGVLAPFMTPEGIRSWIKDGPMKEYARAQRGAGRYARLGRTGGTDATDVAARALGVGAQVTPDSLGVKPAHCVATTASGEAAYLVWGSSANFRNLLWAALRAATADGLAAHIVVLEPPTQPTPTTDVRSQQAIAARCAVGLHYLTERIGRTREDTGTPKSSTTKGRADA